MPDEIDEFALETLSQLHAVATDFFVPFVIHRLASNDAAKEAVLTVEIRDVGIVPRVTRKVRLSWEQVPALPPAVGERTITEWAALGVACVVIWQYLGARLSAVSMSGDRFDYWLLRHGERFCLEVSGTQEQNLESRHREKVRQLLDNPYDVKGFVVTVSFGERRVILSFAG